MDPPNTAQDVARCDICKTSMAESYCDFCHVNLCKPCIGEHISDDYKKHIIVSFQDRRSTLIYPKCESHPNEDCKYQCKDCNTFVCFHCSVSNQHQGHDYVNLEELFTTLKKHIKEDADELENLLLPTYEEIAIELKNQIDSLDDEYGKLTREMSKHREDMHREVDNAMNQMDKEIGEIKVKHHGILKKHLDEIKETQSFLQQTQFDLGKLEDTNKVCLAIDYRSKNKEFSNLPSRIKVTMPKFISKQIDKEGLSRVFGEVSPLSTMLEERILKARKSNTSVSERIDIPEVLNTIKAGYAHLRSVTFFDEEQIWTSGETADIKCFNIQGALQKTIKTKSRHWPNDIAVDRDGALLYSDPTTRIVYKVKNDQTEEIIKLQGWTPLNLCVTSSGDLLVTMYNEDETQSKVVRYSGSAVKQTIQFDVEGQPLYSGNSFFKNISENRNLDICVADIKGDAVVVVNQSGKLRFRYTGHPSPTKSKPLKLWGITTDSQSRILTSDCNNHCIHILDADGQFLRYIDNCNLVYPYGLCMGNDENILVCENRRSNIKRIRYQQ